MLVCGIISVVWLSTMLACDVAHCLARMPPLLRDCRCTPPLCLLSSVASVPLAAVGAAVAALLPCAASALVNRQYLTRSELAWATCTAVAAAVVGATLAHQALTWRHLGAI